MGADATEEVDPGHMQVAHDQIRTTDGGEPESLPAVRGLDDAGAERLQEATHRLSDAGGS